MVFFFFFFFFFFFLRSLLSVLRSTKKGPNKHKPHNKTRPRPAVHEPRFCAADLPAVPCARRWRLERVDANETAGAPEKDGRCGAISRGMSATRHAPSMPSIRSAAVTSHPADPHDHGVGRIGPYASATAGTASAAATAAVGVFIFLVKFFKKNNKKKKKKKKKV
jgi:hypothetical protein